MAEESSRRRRLSSFLSSKNHILKATEKMCAQTGAHAFVFLQYEGRKWSRASGLSEAEVVKEWRETAAREVGVPSPNPTLNNTDKEGEIPRGWLSVGSDNPAIMIQLPPAAIFTLRDGDVPNQNWLNLIL